MKRFIIFFLFLILISGEAFTNEKDSVKITGTPLFLIYTNFHQGISKSASESNFDVARAYLGYDFNMKNGFRAAIKIDIGSPNDDSQYSLIRRSAYFRNVEIGYKYKGLSLSIGIIDNQQHKVQEKFWGKRYIYKSYIDEHSFISSTDLGLAAKYGFNEKFSIEAGMTNGKYLSYQTGLKKYVYSLGANYDPYEKLKIKMYSVYTGKENDILTSGVFIGYTINQRIKVGGEYNINAEFIEPNPHTLYGFSIYGEFSITPKINIFARYDVLNSNIPENYSYPWNLDENGSAIIGGIEYRFNKNIRLSMNYQDWYPMAANMPNNAYLFINLEFGIFDSYKRI